MQLHDRGLSEVLYNPSIGHERLDESRDRLAPMVDALAERAKQGGRLRPDFEGTDIVFIQVALTALMNRTRTLAPELYRRYLTIVLDGMPRQQEGPLRKLPVSALTVEETRAIGSRQTASSPGRLPSRLGPQNGRARSVAPGSADHNSNGTEESPTAALSRLGGKRRSSSRATSPS